MVLGTSEQEPTGKFIEWSLFGSNRMLDPDNWNAREGSHLSSFVAVWNAQQCVDKLCLRRLL